MPRPAKDVTPSKPWYKRFVIWSGIIGVVVGSGLIGIIYNDVLIVPSLKFQISNSAIKDSDCCLSTINLPSETVSAAQLITNEIAITNTGSESATNLWITVTSKDIIYRVDKAFSTEQIDVVHEGSHIITAGVTRLAPNGRVAINITSVTSPDVRTVSSPSAFEYQIYANFDQGGTSQKLFPAVTSVDTRFPAADVVPLVIGAVAAFLLPLLYSLFREYLPYRLRA
jgi:hypothetical protein